MHTSISEILKEKSLKPSRRSLPCLAQSQTHPINLNHFLSVPLSPEPKPDVEVLSQSISTSCSLLPPQTGQSGQRTAFHKSNLAIPCANYGHDFLHASVTQLEQAFFLLQQGANPLQAEVLFHDVFVTPKGALHIKSTSYLWCKRVVLLNDSIPIQVISYVLLLVTAYVYDHSIHTIHLYMLTRNRFGWRHWITKCWWHLRHVHDIDWVECVLMLQGIEETFGAHSQAVWWCEKMLSQGKLHISV